MKKQERHQITCYFTDRQLEWIKKQSQQMDRKFSTTISIIINDVIELTEDNKS